MLIAFVIFMSCKLLTELHMMVQLVYNLSFENGALQQSKGLNQLEQLVCQVLKLPYTHRTQIQDQACLHIAFEESIFNGKQSKHLMPMRQQSTSSVQLVTIRSRLNRKYITHFCQQQIWTHINIPSLSARATWQKIHNDRFCRLSCKLLTQLHMMVLRHLKTEH